MKANYKCKICGYVYDSELGDPISGIAEGTTFSDIPENWTCPICGAKTTEFEQIED
jgi:rubredoxin